MEQRSEPAERASSASHHWPVEEGSYFGRHWSGDLALGVSFWLNGVVLNIVVSLIVYFVVYAIARSGSIGGTIAILVVVAVFSVILSVWQLVGIWRSAEKHKEYTGHKGWATVAQILVALGWIGLVVNMGKLIRAIGEVSQL